jgi:two-component system phosphate regulon response regulator PhoB
MTGKQILIVEDEKPIRDMIAFGLRRAGFEVSEAEDCTSARERIADQRPDLLLVDWMLPDQSGLELTRAVKRSRETEDLPVILLTARAEEQDKVSGLDGGADDYMTKPFSPKELRARIRAALRRNAAPEAPSVFRFGDTELDSARCELRRAGSVVETTPTEFKLLSAFVRNRGRVLTREKLLDEAWGPGTFLTDRVVDNHIVALRKKIEPEPADPRFLISVRGMGYRFDG